MFDSYATASLLGASRLEAAKRNGWTMGNRRTIGIVLAGAAVLAATNGPLATRAQSLGIHVAGATSTSPLQLSRGCDQIITDSPAGAAVSAIVTLSGPPSAVVSIWRFNNATQTFQVGYFADPAAPVDFHTTGGGTPGRATEAYFVCLN